MSTPETDIATLTAVIGGLQRDLQAEREARKQQEALVQQQLQAISTGAEAAGEHTGSRRMNSESLKLMPRYDYDESKPLPHGSWKVHIETLKRWFVRVGITEDEQKQDYLMDTINLFGKTKLSHVLNPHSGRPVPKTFDELVARASTVFEKSGTAQVARQKFLDLKQDKMDFTTYLHTKHALYMESLTGAGLNGEAEPYNIEYLTSEAMNGLNNRHIAEKVYDSPAPFQDYQDLIDRVAFYVGRHQCKVKARIRDPLAGPDGKKRETRSAAEPMEIGQMSGGTKQRTEGACHNCGKKGHYARDCRSKKQETKRGKNGGRPGKDKEQRRCFKCKKRGHLANQC